jgi:hypothetical protein
MKTSELLQQIKEECNCLQNTNIEEKIKNPPWEIYQKIHNWMNYVPECLKRNWSKLSKETKIVIFYLCEKQADAEDWD